MADPVTLTIGALAAAGTVMQGIGAYQEGKVQGKIADANADIMRQNAARQRLETAINEDRRREQNRRQLSRNIAAMSEMGMASSPTSIGVLGQQATDLEQNALDLRYKGLSAAESMDIQAANYNWQGKNYRMQGRNAFYGSLIGAPVSFAKGYTAAGGTF